MKKTIIGVMAFCFFLGGMVYLQSAAAEMEVKLIKEIDLKSDPLDIFQSPDGEQLFILTRGEVLVYSLTRQSITDQFPVGKEFDRITYAPRNKTLTLTSRTNKKVHLLSLETIRKFDISGLPFKGPEDAPVLFVVFSDYQCTYCSQLKPILQQVLEKYPKEVKLVIKHFPLPSHKMAEKAAMAALASHQQGKFWEFHDKLFVNQSSLNEAKFQEIAKELGLNVEKFNQDLNDLRLKSLIGREINQARQADIRGVPAIFVNGRQQAQRSFQELQQVVENELKKRK